MHARVASLVLLGLGTIDILALNLLLAPRLASLSAASAPASFARPHPNPSPGRGSDRRSEADAAGSSSLARATPAPSVRSPQPVPAPQAVGARAEAHTEVYAASLKTGPTGPARTGWTPSDVEFSRDSTRIERLPAFRDLRRVIQELSADPDRQLLLRGHSDPLGNPSYNLDLGRRRAEAVKRYLVQRGAPPDRIAVEAVGAAEPVDPRPRPTAWARNRRVEIVWR